jgi:hypothetical protein
MTCPGEELIRAIGVSKFYPASSASRAISDLNPASVG